MLILAVATIVAFAILGPLTAGAVCDGKRSIGRRRQGVFRRAGSEIESPRGYRRQSRIELLLRGVGELPLCLGIRRCSV
jgi:hypothetical protein